ncbi:Opine oxidase subunit B [Fusarium heterosporum]|uniref:Opine oxidase subunit B n=1 Tax=Fusarium heterosporum TaxID=42747 RepID=A0A8H5TEP4_FUSHE|nr:Opine oxidase subunit B [Fusarium heterosporum]
MEKPTSPHVIVIGGGIVGASIAWHLAHETTVTVVAEDIGGPATTASFAWLNASSASQKFYYEFRCRSLQRWKEIHQEIPGMPITWSGSLNWQKPTDKRIAIGDNLNIWGYDVVRMDHADISKSEPRINKDILPDWGLRYPVEGAIEADVAARQFIAAAEAKGKAKLIKATVKSFCRSAGQITGVTLSSGQEIYGDHVVVAAGIGSVSLLATENIAIPVTPVPALIVNSKPTQERLLNKLINSKYLYMRQTRYGVIRAGCENPGDSPGEDPEKTARDVFSKLQQSLVGGNKLEFDYYTVGLKPTPEGGLPIIGPTGIEGVSIAVMHSGVTNAAIVGELLSRQILTGEAEPLLSHFRLDRFAKPL